MTRAVFLHAFGADRLSWAGTTPALAGVECLTPDLPGHGTALGDLGPVTLDRMAAQVAQDLPEGPAWLVGHSLGGGVALEMAAADPGRWSGLVLLAPLGLGTGARFADLRAYAEITEAEQMRNFLEGLVVEKALIAPPFVTYALDQLGRPGARAAMAQIAAALPAMERAVQGRLERLAKAGLDITVLWGANDPVITADRGKIRGIGTLERLPATGHIVHVEAMKRVNTVLRERITP